MIDIVLPFGLDFGDEQFPTIDDGSSNPIIFNVSFPYFGVLETMLVVS